MPCDHRRYHPDWKSIVRQIKDQAGDCCEFCGAPNRVEVARNVSGEWMPEDELERMNSTDGWLWLGTFDPLPPVRIVLTVAHLDHDVNNNDPCNLRALCQKCHLAWDHERRMAKAAQTREAKRLTKQPVLF